MLEEMSMTAKFGDPESMSIVDNHALDAMVSQRKRHGMKSELFTSGLLERFEAQTGRQSTTTRKMRREQA